METAELLTAITRCHVVDLCRADKQLPCKAVALDSQPPDQATFQVPEPWSGRLETAPILFVSSNPSIDLAELYPTSEWTDADRVAFFRDRFAPGDPPWIDDRMRARQRDPANQPARGTTYWFATQARAAELLGRPPVPGVDYALTEVVHCKSTDEIGVSKAASTCSATWLRPILRLAGARVVVLMGAVAREAFAAEFRWPRGAFEPPHELEGRPRIVLQLPHPNAHTKRVDCAPLTAPELDTARAYLRGA
jgi:hypothetical protein